MHKGYISCEYRPPILYIAVNQLGFSYNNIYLNILVFPTKPYPAIMLLRVIYKSSPVIPQKLLYLFSFSLLNFCFQTTQEIYAILKKKKPQFFLLIGLVQPSNVPRTKDHVGLVKGCSGPLSSVVGTILIHVIIVVQVLTYSSLVTTKNSKGRDGTYPTPPW